LYWSRLATQPDEVSALDSQSSGALDDDSVAK
jgi:hypothetical protein